MSTAPAPRPDVSAPAPFVPPPQPTAYDLWVTEIRRLLRAWRAPQLADWPTSKFGSLPCPCWHVEGKYSAHSYTEQKVYEMLRLIGQGEYNRPAVSLVGSGSKYPRTRGQGAITGRKVGPEGTLEWHAIVSLQALAGLLSMAVATLERTILHLAAKHSIGRLQLRRRGERVGNREPSAYHIRTYEEVLRLRREDPTIATTHGDEDPSQSMQWHNGRANSRRLLTPAEAEMWNLKSMPAKPRSAKPAPHEQPADADKELAEATPEQAQPSGPAPGPAGQRDTTIVPPDQKKKLDDLCSFVAGARLKIDATVETPGVAVRGIAPMRPVDCDLAPAILAAAQATAAAKGKVFPPEGIAELCGWFFEKKSKRGRQPVFNEARNETERHEVPLWTADQPAAYLLTCCGNLEKPEQVLKLVDNYEHRAQREKREAEQKAQKAEREAHERICNSLQMMREHRNDPQIMELALALGEQYPELYSRLWVEDDRRHGGDGAGSSWKTPARKTGKAGPVPSMVSEAIAKLGGHGELDGRIYHAALDQAKQVGVAMPDEVVVSLIQEIASAREASSLDTYPSAILTAMPGAAIEWSRARRAGKDSAETTWELVKRELKAKLALDSYLNWIQKTRGARIEAGRLVVATPNAETSQWIAGEYSGMIGAILQELALPCSGVEYEVAEQKGKPPPARAP